MDIQKSAPTQVQVRLNAKLNVGTDSILWFGIGVQNQALLEGSNLAASVRRRQLRPPRPFGSGWSQEAVAPVAATTPKSGIGLTPSSPELIIPDASQPNHRNPEPNPIHIDEMRRKAGRSLPVS